MRGARAPLALASVLALGGCAPTLNLVYQPPPDRPAAPAPPLRFAVAVDAGSARIGKTASYAYRLKFAKPPGPAIQTALEAELERLGFVVARGAEEPDARLSAELLELLCVYPSNSVHLTLSLALRDRVDRLVGRRLVRGFARSGREHYANQGGQCAKWAPTALAHALGQVGPIFDGEGWIEAVTGARSPERAALPFPRPREGPSPSVLLLPVEDAVGPLFAQAYLTKSDYPIIASVADLYEEAAADELSRSGFRLVERRADADWIVRSGLTHGWLEGHLGKTFVRLRFVAQVSDRSGAALWQGPLDVKADRDGNWSVAHRLVPEAVPRAAAGLADALQGRAPAPLLADSELRSGFVNLSMLGRVDWARAASLAGSLGSAPSALEKLSGKEGVLGAAQGAARLAETGRKLAETAARAEALTLRVPQAFANVKLAVLPMHNLGVDLRGPALLRQVVQMQLGAAGFRLEGLDWIDGRLREVGVTDGGQLGSQTPSAIGTQLASDALLYGVIEEFDDKNAGVWASRSVAARLWLVDARTGAKLWEASRKKSNPKVALSGEGVRQTLLAGYGEKLLESALQSPLRPEAEDVVRQLVKDLVAQLEKR